MVRAKINLRFAELAQFGQQFFAILHVGVIRFIRAEKSPYRGQLADALTGIDSDGDGKSGVSRGLLKTLERTENRGEKIGNTQTAHEVPPLIMPRRYDGHLDAVQNLNRC